MFNNDYDPMQKLEELIVATNNNTQNVNTTLNLINNNNAQVQVLINQVSNLSKIVHQQEQRLSEIEAPRMGHIRKMR